MLPQAHPSAVLWQPRDQNGVARRDLVRLKYLRGIWNQFRQTMPLINMGNASPGLCRDGRHI